MDATAFLGGCRGACSSLRAVALGRTSVLEDPISAKPGKQEVASDDHRGQV